MSYWVIILIVAVIAGVVKFLHITLEETENETARTFSFIGLLLVGALVIFFYFKRCNDKMERDNQERQERMEEDRRKMELQKNIELQRKKRTYDASKTKRYYDSLAAVNSSRKK